MTGLTITPKRAILSNGELLFEHGADLQGALADGCFMLSVPIGICFSPGIRLARNFYRERNGGSDDAYRGYNKLDDIYYDRDHFQTEHLLLDREQRQRHLPVPMVTLGDRLCAVGREILRAVLTHLEVPSTAWDRAVVGSLDGRAVEWLAVSHYRSERRQLGCPAHKDTGFVTVLYFEQSGLEAWSDGNWKRIDPVPGYILINFGGALELLTRKLNRKVGALLHRVAECNPDSGEERFSIAAFVNPPATGQLCELDGDGQAHPVQSVEEFLREFNNETWQDSYKDFGISSERHESAAETAR